MGSTDNFFSGIDKVLDIVDEAISTNNYSNMANQIQKSVKPYSKKQLSEEEIEAEVKQIIAQVGATSMKEMGRVMGIASKQMAGRAEGGKISAIVKKLLS